MCELKVLLFNPPPPRGFSEELQAPHVGLAYLAAVLEERGFKVWVVDAHPFGQGGLSLLPLMVKRIKPDVVGITSTTSSISLAYEAADVVKRVSPGSTVVMGGPHVTFLDREALKECEALDVVVRGEGEETLIEVVERLEDGRSLKGVLGVTYRGPYGRAVREPDRPLIEDLDSLPFPSYRHLPLDLYRSFGLKPPSLPVVTSRGCPFKCSFCVAWRLYKGKWRKRSPSNVVDELEHHVETYGVTDFSFVDDLFTLSRRRVKEICREIRRRGLKVTWGCSARVDTIDRDTLLEMKAAGCHTVYFGVESGSSKTLSDMGKGFTVERTVEAFKLCRELGVGTVASVILFWPTETRRDVEETLRFVKSLDSDVAQFCIATPFPGTELYDRLKRKGLLCEEDWSKYDIVTPVFETAQFDRKYMVSKWKRAYLSFYLRPSYVAKQLVKRSLPLLKAMLHMFKRGLTYRLRLPSIDQALRANLLEVFLRRVLLKVNHGPGGVRTHDLPVISLARRRCSAAASDAPTRLSYGPR